MDEKLEKVHPIIGDVHSRKKVLRFTERECG
jgi:hypothetical protein